jgi:hypothetical protein
MAPFSLIMPEVPAHITDGEIAYIWDVAGRSSVRIRSIQMEPCCLQHGDYNRVTIHFDEFNGYGIELRESIMNGYYSIRTFDLNDLRKGQLPHAHMPLKNSYLLPCETPQPPRTEYSHVVALQLQDVVRQQAEQIRMLEAQLQLHKDYNNDIHDMIIALEAKHEAENKLHAEENAILNQKLAAVIEWCSQPVWRRKFAAFISPK